ncbi:MAG: Cell division ATP-binding protein FtsE [Firmicutes bacterium ADurb.Bin193]|nr:MAG: Cell division ATP-binding protein FtsE [Firmicutes bacterium ADurb.Bin193]
MIFFNNITKKYENGTVALDNVSFFVDKGEFVFIVGSSGAGKSTITKLILCEEKPTSGSVLINGINVGGLKQKEMPYYRRQLGMVFQDFRLLPNKSVYDNIAFAMQVRGASTKEIRRSVPNVLSMVGLSSKARVRPNQLSGGEQQRVSLARAMVNNPPVLIADEPTGNLDPSTAYDIMRLLEDINKKGTTVLAVTHARDIVNKMKKRVIEIDNGSIIRDEVGGYSNES